MHRCSGEDAAEVRVDGLNAQHCQFKGVKFDKSVTP